MSSHEESNKTCIETHRCTDLKNHGTEFGATTTIKSVERSPRDERTRKGELQIRGRKPSKTASWPLNSECGEQNSSIPIKDKKY